MSNSYATPAAFKQALEQRLRTRASATRVILARCRQLVGFQRFLARTAEQFNDRAVLKGGMVLELRLQRARTTKDIDLRCVGDPRVILQELRAAGRLDLGDYMTFEVATHPQHPVIQNDGMPYDGIRFRTECLMAGKPYGQPFGIDVAFGDPITEPTELIAGHDVLAFAGVPCPSVRVYPIETQIAEKLHAYTLPRVRPNSRVKDLPDLALLASIRTLEAVRVRAAIKRTFAYRETHPVPQFVPTAPDDWMPKYAAIAAEDDLPWRDLEGLLKAVRAFLDPVLSGAPIELWRPERWDWQDGHERADDSTSQGMRGAF